MSADFDHLRDQHPHDANQSAPGNTEIEAEIGDDDAQTQSLAELVELEGWLFRISDILLLPKKRFFRLDPHRKVITFFQNDYDTRPEGRFELQDGFQIREIEDDPLGFEVSISGKKMVLRASQGAAQKAKWLRALEALQPDQETPLPQSESSSGLRQRLSHALLELHGAYKSRSSAPQNSSGRMALSSVVLNRLRHSHLGSSDSESKSSFKKDSRANDKDDNFADADNNLEMAYSSAMTMDSADCSTHNNSDEDERGRSNSDSAGLDQARILFEMLDDAAAEEADKEKELETSSVGRVSTGDAAQEVPVITVTTEDAEEARLLSSSVGVASTLPQSERNTERVARVEVYTGKVKGASTHANVFITLHGSFASTPRTAINKKNKIRRNLVSRGFAFQRGQMDEFVFRIDDIGDVERITIEHDNSGIGPGWFLDKVIVTVGPLKDLSPRLYFPCYRWLAKDEDDGIICRDLLPVPEDQCREPASSSFTVVDSAAPNTNAASTSPYLSSLHSSLNPNQPPSLGRLYNSTGMAFEEEADRSIADGVLPNMKSFGSSPGKDNSRKTFSSMLRRHGTWKRRGPAEVRTRSGDVLRTSGFAVSVDGGPPVPLTTDIIDNHVVFFRRKKRRRTMAYLHVEVLAARNLRSQDMSGKSDAMCELCLEKCKMRTAVCFDALQPTWNETFVFSVTEPMGNLEVVVCDYDSSKSGFMGRVRIPITALEDTNMHDRWYFLEGPDEPETRTKDDVDEDDDVDATPPLRGELRVRVRLKCNPREYVMSQFLSVPLPHDNIRPEPFRVKHFATQCRRVKLLWGPIKEMNQERNRILNWENPLYTALCFLMYVWCSLHIHLMPAILPLIFILTTLKKFAAIPPPSSPDDVVTEQAKGSSSGGKKGRKDKAKQQNIIRRLQAMQEGAQSVQNGLDRICTALERIKNMFNWTCPWRTVTALCVLLLISVILFTLPAEYLFLLIGCHQFTRRFRAPGNVMWNFVSRVADDFHRPVHSKFVVVGSDQDVLCASMSNGRKTATQKLARVMLGSRRTADQ